MTRYRPESLVRFAATLLDRAGMERSRADIVAEVLVEGDLLGHSTHGLELLPRYLEEIASGGMCVAGDPEIVSDRGAVAVWAGRKLSGVWLTVAALDEASRRASAYGIGAIAIRQSHHIACLAAYMERIASRGQVAILVCSDPSVATVAPHGGSDGVFSPDPIALGIPTDRDPIIIDMSTSISSMGMANRLARSGERFPGKWALDADGNATDDPAAISTKPAGTLLPTGGVDHGHKGYGLALMVEALSQGLSGGGRSDQPGGWGASVFALVCEPELFAGLAAFNRELGTIAALCRRSRPARGHDAVRLPGERALERKRSAMASGLQLFPGIIERLELSAERLGVCERPVAVA